MSIARKPAALAACLALAAGGGGAAVLTASAGASTVPSSATTAHKSHADVHKGTGSFTVTGPKGKTRTRNDVKLSCRVVKGRYVVSSGGKRHRLRLIVKDYKGAGSYTATALVTRHTSSGTSRHHYKVPVTLTATGGSATYSRTLSGKRDAALKGKTISASASWTCSV
jgi:hypothetical protein